MKQSCVCLPVLATYLFQHECTCPILSLMPSEPSHCKKCPHHRRRQHRHRHLLHPHLRLATRSCAEMRRNSSSFWLSLCAPCAAPPTGEPEPRLSPPISGARFHPTPGSGLAQPLHRIHCSCHLLHVMEEDLKRHDIPLVFTRLLHEVMFASNAFTFYNGVSPYNALYGRQPAMLHDLPALDHEQETETSDHTREEVIRKVSLEAITQATAVAKSNKALRANTSITGQHYYREGGLVDYHRPTTTKDDWDGWNGLSRCQTTLTGVR